MVHHELTGKMDWSLIRWIKEEVLVGENSFLHTIRLWTYDDGPMRIEIEATKNYGYARVCSDFLVPSFKCVQSETKDYVNQFLRTFVENYYKKNAIVMRISAGGDGQNVLWSNPKYEKVIYYWNRDLPNKYASVIQRYWKIKQNKKVLENIFPSCLSLKSAQLV